MDGGGWMPWANICTDCMLDRCKGTEGDLLAAIRDSEKDRFEIAMAVDKNDEPLWIMAARAVQGHSVHEVCPRGPQDVPHPRWSRRCP